MKPSIIINEKPRTVAKLTAALQGPQSRASARLLNLSQLVAFAVEAEGKLDELEIPKRLRAGCHATITPEQPPLAYRYRTDSTAAELVRRPSGWALVWVGRTSVYPIRYGQEAGVVLQRSDAVLQYQLDRDHELARYVRFKIHAAESSASAQATPSSPTKAIPAAALPVPAAVATPLPPPRA